MVDLRQYVHYLHHQENIGCCTASATLLAYETMLNIAGKPEILSRLFLYYETRKAQGRIGYRGADLRKTLEVLQTTGVCREETWSFLKIRENKEPCLLAYEEAPKYKIENFSYALPKEFKYLLHNRIPVIVGLWTGRQFWKMSGPMTGLSYGPIDKEENTLSKGHAVTIVGYDDLLHSGSWIIANSLGPRWGDHGYGILPYSCNENIGESYTLQIFS